MKVLKDSEEQEAFAVFLSEQGSNFPICKWTCYDTGLRSAQIIRWPDWLKKLCYRCFGSVCRYSTHFY